MSKQCRTCGSSVEDNANFCQACGGTDFIMNNYTSNQTSFPQNQQYSNNQTWQQPIPQNQPKKKKTGLIVGIIVAVVIILAGIGIIAEKAFQEQGNGDGGNGNSEKTNYSSEETPEKLYYSMGTFDGSVYTNKWADIKLALPEGFSNADSATYSAAENSNTECGAYFIADDTMSLIYICFEKLPTFPVYNEEKYLDSALKTLKNTSGITYQVPDTYSSADICGHTYKKAECQFNNGNGDFANTIYVRKLDNYMIFISAVGINTETTDALVNNITKAD